MMYSQIPKRINWNALIGISLTKYAARCYAKGMSERQALSYLFNIKPYLLDSCLVHPAIVERARIGIHSRYSEIKSERREIYYVCRQIA